MIETRQIRRLEVNDQLRPGTYFRLVTCNNEAYGPYFVSGKPFAVPTRGQSWIRGVEVTVQNCRLTPTTRDTVILPGVKIRVY